MICIRKVPGMQSFKVHGKEFQALCIEELSNHHTRRDNANRMAELLHRSLKVATCIQILTITSVHLGDKHVDRRYRVRAKTHGANHTTRC